MGRIIRVLAMVGLVSMLFLVSVGCTTDYTLQAIIVSPKAVNLAPSESQQLTVTAGYDKGASINVTALSTCTFSTGDVAIATVTTTGLVQGIAAGSTNITVSYTESRVTKKLTVPVTIK